MKILSIGLVYPSNKIQQTSNKNYYYYNSTSVSQPLKADTVSFGRVAKNAEKMRAMFKYGMIDIHTGQYLIPPEWFENALQNGTFNRSIQSVVKIIKPYEHCLHKVEAEVFKNIEQYAKTNPLFKLDDVIQKLAPEAQARLLELQRPIFQKLKLLSKDLPAEQKAAFDELMATTEKQLENKPVMYKFSKKDFKYKLERIAGDYRRKGVPEEIRAVEKLLDMSNKLPYIPSGRNFLRRKPGFNPKKSLIQANIIRQMDNYFTRSIIKGDKSLDVLFSNSKKQLFNIPTVIPFQRKIFNHDLESIVETIDDKKLAREIMKTASKLPTAQEELCAFIMKSSRNSSVKIGHDLLYGSVGAIDHLDPFSRGGADSLENYGFSSNALNSRKGNKKMSRWLRENPLTYYGSQKAVDRLLELYREGILDKEGLSPWYIVTFAKRMKKLSSPEKPLVLDLGGLEQELNQKRG